MLKQICFWLLFFICYEGTAQLKCGTPTPAIAQRIPAGYNYRPAAGEKQVQVYFYNIYNNNGTDSAWSLSEINNEFQTAFQDYKAQGICLVFTGLKKLYNDGWLNFNSGNINQITSGNGNFLPDCINIYLHQTLSDGTELNGLAYDIPSYKLSVSRGAINNRSLGHELGHCFGLYHTFETAFGLECPDGSNCTEAGDYICDTRATPADDKYMSDNTNTSCVYTGNKTIDCNGANRAYNPEINNYMSYGRRACRLLFSPNQVSRMVWNIDNTVNNARVSFNKFITGSNGAISYYADLPLQDWNAGNELTIGDYNKPFSGLVVVQGTTIITGKAMSRITLKPGTYLRPGNGGRVRLLIIDLCSFRFLE